MLLCHLSDNELTSHCGAMPQLLHHDNGPRPPCGRKYAQPTIPTHVCTVASYSEFNIDVTVKF